MSCMEAHARIAEMRQFANRAGRGGGPIGDGIPYRVLDNVAPVEVAIGMAPDIPIDSDRNSPLSGRARARRPLLRRRDR